MVLGLQPGQDLRRNTQQVGVTDEDTLSSLAGRLVRLAKSLGTAEQAEVKERSGGLSLADLSNRLLDAIDADKIQESG